MKPISVCGAHTYMGTLDAMADEEGSTGFVMACSCASNGPGGGAIANAEVTGVSFESIAKLAGER